VEFTWNTTWCHGILGMPLAVAVACPRCGSESRFVPPFRFVSGDTPNPKRLRRWNSLLVVERFPEVFPWTDRDNPFPSMFWGTPKRRWEDYPIVGVLKCPACTLLRKHRLTWPADAFYRVRVGRATLWAWDRRSLIWIRDHIAATDRPKRRWPILKYLPSHFLAAKRRGAIVRAIDSSLAAAASHPRSARSPSARPRRQPAAKGRPASSASIRSSPATTWARRS
jgi:hypothetical protein